MSSDENTDALNVLLALNAAAGQCVENRLTLFDTPYVIFFSGRPNRMTGHVPVAALMAMWAEGPNNLESDPPNAVLSIFDDEGGKTAVIELSRPTLIDNKLSFDFAVIGGDDIPGYFFGASLYIDEIQAPDAWAGM